jgi:hypothetical protein
MAQVRPQDVSAIPDGLVEVGPRDRLAAVTVVSGGRHGIAVFAPAGSDEIYAIDNRCPHMGFPLHKGTVCDGILTCHWHPHQSLASRPVRPRQRWHLRPVRR